MKQISKNIWQWLCQVARKLKRISPPEPLSVRNGIPPSKAEIGHWGESYAAYLLQTKGFHIAERNFKENGHEIDIIATKGDLVVFCEVKTRSLTPEMVEKFGRPALAVGHEQKKNIRMAAAGYMAFYARGKKPRFDVIEIYLTEGQPLFEIWKACHIEDAFRT